MPHRLFQHAQWRVASYSGDTGSCVEVAGLEPAVAIRDSKDRAGLAFVMPQAAFAGLVAEVKEGKLDL